MSRFQSLLVGSLVIGQLLVPSVAFAASGKYSKNSKTTTFSLPANFFLPIATKPQASPTPAPVPTATTKTSTSQYNLPVIFTFNPVPTPTTVAASVKPLAMPIGVPLVTASPEATKSPVKQSVLPQEKKDTIKMYFNSMQGKLSDLVEKLGNLAARMESKVAELKDKNVNTTAIEKAITAAKDKIAKAKADLADAAIKVNDLLVSADRKAAFDSLKAVVLDVQENLKVAHELLTEGAGQLKKAYQSMTPASANK